MTAPFRTVALAGRYQTEGVSEALARIATFLRRRGISVLLEQSTAEAIGRPDDGTDTEEIGHSADLAIAVGGDGTMLGLARELAPYEVPLIGINHGRLGFITDIGLESWHEALGSILDGHYLAEERTLLTTRVVRAQEIVWNALALNDVVVQKWETGRMLDFETWIDGAFVNSHGGDGLVIASSTGSTAYALSCGGPIVAPHLDVLVVAPICPHTLSDRPIVVSSRSVIAVSLIDRPDTRAQVTCDGVPLGELLPGERLEVHPTERKITLLHPGKFEYYRLLRSKLHWGRGSFHKSE